MKKSNELNIYKRWKKMQQKQVTRIKKLNEAKYKKKHGKNAKETE